MVSSATLNALEAARQPVVVGGTTRTAGLADAGSYLHFTNSDAKALTVPPESDVPWVPGLQVHLRNGLAGNLTVQAGVGVTVQPPGRGSLILGPSMTAMLYYVGSNVWHLIGQTD